MAWILDFVYALLALVSSPVWLIRMIATGKIKTDWKARFGRTDPLPSADPGRPRVLLHAVSVGEVNAIRQLVAQLAPRFDVVVATTTDTGTRRARTLYSESHHVVRYPFDFSWCVKRFLAAINPDVVGLVELEVWPNFTRECRRRHIPVAVVNGRLSAGSFKGYRRIRPLIRPMFRRLTAVAAQDETIARRFTDLGVPRSAVQVLGTMKWDTAEIADTVAGTDDLARAFGPALRAGCHVVVAGSTGPGEERLIARCIPPDVTLILVPRKPERFDEVAAAFPGCIRRSRATDDATADARICLLDTIGDLRAACCLADLVIVGRTFNNQHGSDMIEPIALGKAVVVGPDVSNFESVARAFIDANAMVQVHDEAELKREVGDLLSDPQRRDMLGQRGRDVIRSHLGTTEAHVDMITSLLTQ
ncbi:MAG: hypothetical protein D8M59_06495 [Planctomycetes bacterium]|nr:hypothetical protein [Planctomycetota bacterium]NOG55149.1 glycosyltransferase [Planctomycetota bacterium]